MNEFPAFGPLLFLMVAALLAVMQSARPALEAITNGGKPKSRRNRKGEGLMSAFLDHDFREPVEVVNVGVAQNPEFNKGLPKGAIAWFTFIVTGANNSIGGTAIDKYVSTVDSDDWLDITATEMRALFDYVYSRYGGQIPATADLTWSLPLELLAMLAPAINGGRPPIVGLPSGLEKTFMFRMNTNSTAGTIQLGWILSGAEPTHMPYMIGKTLAGLTASTNDNRYELNIQPYPVVGFIVDWGATEITRMKIYAADDAGRVTELTDVQNDNVLSLLQPYNNAGITDPIFIPLSRPIEFKKGSYLLLNLGAGYNGTQRIVPVMLIPIKRATPAASAA